MIYNMDEIKICSKCGNKYPKSLKYFPKHSHSKNSLYSYCRTCYNKIKKEKDIKNWENSMIRKMGNSRLKKSNGLFLNKTITKEDIKRIYKKQNGLCYWLEIPLDITFTDKLRQPSIDRLDNSRGYEPDNIVLTCKFANLGRQSSTEEDFLNFINNYIHK